MFENDGFDFVEPISSPPLAVVVREISLYEASKSVYKSQVDTCLLTMPRNAPPPNSQAVRRNLHHTLEHAFVVENILSPEECNDLIQQIETIGLTKWTTDEARLHFRDCDTIEIEHRDLAQLIWSRMQCAMLAEEKDCTITSEDYRHQRDLEGRWLATGTVKDILFSRYSEGGHFAIHTDGFNIEAFDKRSLFSVVLYLNDLHEGQGGETVFYSKGDMQRDANTGIVIGDASRIIASERPKAGAATVFYHNIFHQSQPIVGCGVKKYIIRSDVMFQRTPKLCTKQVDIDAFEMYQRAEFIADSDPEESAKLFRLAFKRSALLSEIYGV